MDTIRELGRAPACAAAARGGVVASPSHPVPSALALARSRYLAALGVLFALFNSARVLAYLPTIWAVTATGDSSQHSLWTWFTFFGGNATMAA